MVCVSLQKGLYARHELGKPIVVGLSGAGQMGFDIIVQTYMMKGIRVGAVCSSSFERTRQAAVVAGYDASDVIKANTPTRIDAAIEAGRIAVTDDFTAMSKAGLVEVIIDATGNPEFGVQLAFSAIQNGKHIVLLNIESEVTVGRAIRKWAESSGVVYTGAAGDEPAATMCLIRCAETLGMEIIAAGKGKNNPLNISAVPDEYLLEARRRNMSPRMLVEFIDGTKTQVEMTALANAAGLTVDVPGMHGSFATLDNLSKQLCPKADGGILCKRGVVEYTMGNGVAPGVFVVVRPRHARVSERMVSLKVGEGPYFTLSRPFHLTSLEVPLSAARAVLHGSADIQTLNRPYVECCAIAKRNLEIGEKLGCIGMGEYRGLAVTYRYAREKYLMPIGLCEGAVIRKRVQSGEFITHSNTVADENLMITRVRKELDAEYYDEIPI